jgi:hypothetical protein
MLDCGVHAQDRCPRQGDASLNRGHPRSSSRSADGLMCTNSEVCFGRA